MKIISIPEGFNAQSWCNKNKIDILESMAQHGALFFKKANIDSDLTFEEVVNIFSKNLFLKNGEHEPYNLKGTVQTPVFYSEDQRLLWHSENTFNYTWPTKIFFACLKPPSSNGETVTLDNRKLSTIFSKNILEKFAREGVVYERNYIPNVGIPYKQILGIESEDDLQEHCIINDIKFNWIGKTLKTLSHRPAVVDHPSTLEKCFVAQLLHWHPRCLDPSVREYLVQVYGKELPRNVFFGDGTVIEDNVIDDVMAYCEENEEYTPWQKGELLLIDNILCSHGRRQYSGDRTILVSLTDPLPITQFS